jgi:hypothetical protein
MVPTVNYNEQTSSITKHKKQALQEQLGQANKYSSSGANIYGLY